MSHLDSLNKAQQCAVTTTDGPLMVIAGAGTGKTRVITHRILHLIESGILPERILGITFTNKAAGEMRERVATLLEHSSLTPTPSTPYPLLCTFHSLGVRILREFFHEAEISKTFSIFDHDDSLRTIKGAMKEEGIDPKEFAPSLFLALISRHKGEGQTHEKFTDTAQSHFDEMLLRVWNRYEKELREEKALDFDDLLLRPLQLIRTKPEVRRTLQSRWDFMHIDEYQDTNGVQYELSRILAETHKNICVVGDMDQSIYGWRGAKVRNMLHFERDFPGASVIPLEENYRSTDVILSAANAVIEKNEVRAPKTLFTRAKGGAKITVHTALNEAEEAQFVSEKAAFHIGQGIPASEIAVLYRANFQSRALEEAFLHAGIPYQVVGTRFFERAEVKDALSYIHAAIDGTSMHHMKRIINTPPRGIGKVTLLKIFMQQEHTLSERTRIAIGEFRSILKRIKVVVDNGMPSEVLRTVIRESGMEAMYVKGSDDDAERLENLKELVSLASRYDTLPREESLQKFLEDAALASDQDSIKKERDAVRLMTVHAAKGLEFRVVFVTGLEEGLFPHERDDAVAKEDKEEERRLFYVAITRAKEKLYLTHAFARRIYGNTNFTAPSQFFADIDATLCEETTSSEDGRGHSDLITIDW